MLYYLIYKKIYDFKVFFNKIKRLIFNKEIVIVVEVVILYNLNKFESMK